MIPISLSTLSELGQHSQPLETPSFTFSNSGLELFITTSAGSVDIVDYPSFGVLHRMRGHTSPCHCVSMSPTGTYVATGASDSLVLIWDTQDWIPKYSLTDMTGAVRSVSFSWDGSYVVGGSDEGNGLNITHVESGENVCTLSTAGEKPSQCVGWHPNRYALAYTGGPDGLRIIGGIVGS